MLRPVQADFGELPAHPATTSEFKQLEFFDLAGINVSDVQDAMQTAVGGNCPYRKPRTA